MCQISAIALMGSGLITIVFGATASCTDYIRDLQTEAIKANRADFGHWGHDPANYKLWGSHSNRLIPVYTFGTMNGPEGVDLRTYQWVKSPYRSESELRRIYGASRLTH